MHWETSDGRFRVLVVDIDGQQFYRLKEQGYWRGDYRLIEALLAAAGIELTDLEVVRGE